MELNSGQNKDTAITSVEYIDREIHQNLTRVSKRLELYLNLTMWEVYAAL
jgi:DNA topoisomerase VI subunit B